MIENLSSDMKKKIKTEIKIYLKLLPFKKMNFLYIVNLKISF